MKINLELYIFSQTSNNNYRLNGVVSTVIILGGGNPGFDFRQRNDRPIFSLLKKSQTSCGAHSDLYSMSAVSYFPQYKAVRA
jgi:hypothetical protein